MNDLKIPAGHQIKIDKQIKKIKEEKGMLPPKPPAIVQKKRVDLVELDEPT